MTEFGERFTDSKRCAASDYGWRRAVAEVREKYADDGQILAVLDLLEDRHGHYRLEFLFPDPQQRRWQQGWQWWHWEDVGKGVAVVFFGLAAPMLIYGVLSHWGSCG
jgi:hypothetical protein